MIQKLNAKAAGKAGYRGESEGEDMNAREVIEFLASDYENLAAQAPANLESLRGQMPHMTETERIELEAYCAR